MKKFGHRGAGGYEPENTLASFKKAIELGVDAIELDVHSLKDGTLVVIHDKKVNRTTNGYGYISKKTIEEIKLLDAGNGEKIPTLQEVLDLVNRKVQVNIELKGKNTAFPVSILINEYVRKKNWKYSDFMVSSFNLHELLVFKKLLPKVRIGVLIIGFILQFDKYVALGAHSVNIWSKLVRKSAVEKAHKYGLKLFAYTVNNKSEIAKMKDMGVDGVFSDYPDRIL